jgi:hypothetical protein
MAYSITVSSCKTYIILKVTGTITRESSMGYNREAHALGKSLGIRNYLVDLTESQNGDTVSSNFRFANEDMKGTDIDRAARAALLVDPNDRSHDFVVLASQNAGINMSLFTDRSIAVRFLRGEGVPS